MKPRSGESKWGWLFTPRAWFALWIPIGAITLMHYATGSTLMWAHDIFRRLYYIPIILGAFYFGMRGAMTASIAASILYIPHAFMAIIHFDPAHSTEKFLEILLYNIIAYVTGRLADRQKRVAGKLEDILEEKTLMERQLIRAGRLQALGELTAGLAHEIKNPLASLKGSIEIIGSEISPASPKQKMLTIHRKELDRLNSLLERFLDFARPRHFDIAALNLCAVVDETIALLGSHAGKHRVDIAWRKPDAGYVIEGDREKVKQVVFNLLLNAVQSTESPQRIDVRCGAVQRFRNRYITIEIQDGGPGIPDAVREKIFDPFFTTKDAGTGLGLSVAGRIVDEHGGFIEMESPESGGALFRVLFPASGTRNKSINR